MSYGEQLQRKQERIEALLGRFAPVRPIIGMDVPLRFHCKAEAAFGYAGGKLISGKYRAFSRTIVPGITCPLEHPAASAIIADFTALARDFSLAAYDEKSGKGFLRHVMVRVSRMSGEALVVPVCSHDRFPGRKAFCAKLTRMHPEIRGIVLNVNAKRTSMVLGEGERLLWGEARLEESLLGRRFLLSARSFFQVNPEQTEILYAEALALAGLTGSEIVLDAYCGTGTIGICASRNSRFVIGAELNPDAVRDAIANARLNDAHNCRFYCADAARFASGRHPDRPAGRSLKNEAASRPLPLNCSEDPLFWQDDMVPDVVFTDPPRSGCSPRFLDALARMRPGRIVYVSCDPESLARDVGILSRHGYRAAEFRPVDMFPHTEHVETVSLLSHPKDV